MLGKKASRNGRILNSNRPFDFQSLTQSEPFSFFNSNVLNKHILKTIISQKKKCTTKITRIKHFKFHDFSLLYFNSAFVANVAIFVLKTDFFTRLEISDLLTNFICFAFLLHQVCHS